MTRPRVALPVLVLVVGLIASACGAGGDDATPPTASAGSAPTTIEAIDPEDSTAGASADPIGSIVVLGDSIMAWNAEAGASIPDVIGETLGVPVVNAAVSGALAEEVPEQYARTDRSADWVVFDGGGNDLNDVCGCGECSTVADSILSADGTSGVLADFTEELVAAGKNVAVVGYYELPADAEFGFADCHDDLESMKPRWRNLAERFATVIYVDPSEVVRGDDRVAFDADSVHPSPEGSRLVGEQIALAISSAG